MNLQGLRKFSKRAIDLVLGVLIFLAAAPLMAVIWAAIRLTSPGPAIFVQRRIGFRGKPFNFYKFRTMYVDGGEDRHREYVKHWIANESYSKGSETEHKVFKIVDDDRITPIGRVLRRYSLDELPQIINVLKSDMSLVGPRPALEYEVKLYKDWHKQRLLGMPGVTGLWQVAGRNKLSFDEMVHLDIEYLKNWNVFADLRLLALTIPAVLSGMGH